MNSPGMFTWVLYEKLGDGIKLLGILSYGYDLCEYAGTCIVLFSCVPAMVGLMWRGHS